MLKKILGAVLALGVIFGGVAVAAPAQAVTGADALYYGQGVNVPDSYRAHVHKENGTLVQLALHQRSGTSVDRICPGNSSHRLRVERPNGSTVYLDNGRCFYPVFEGTHLFWILNAN